LANEISPTHLKRVKSDFALEIFQSFQQRFFKKIKIDRENFPSNKAEPIRKIIVWNFRYKLLFSVFQSFLEQHMVASNLMWNNCSLLY
jgi:hypothetical protein